MGYAEAVKDNIHRAENGGYYPPCHICGTSVFSYNYIRGLKYTCPECRKYLIEAKFGESDEKGKTKKLKNAINRIEKVADISKYESAIKIVERNLNKRGWFQSTEEIMVVLELLRWKIKVHHQVKIYSYSVDFVLPDFKVVLEIDGPMHRLNSVKEKESIRDELICLALGSDYEVIRINTENINLNVTKLLDGIKAIKKYRRNKK